jgi:hypothetical protein
MLKGEDILLLLKLTHASPDWTLRTLEQDTTIARSVAQRSIRRLAAAGLFDNQRRAPNVSQAEEFLVHGARYVFPAELGGESRGFVTAWGTGLLAARLAVPANDLPPVWPSAAGDTRGAAVQPIHLSAVPASRRDPLLWEELALVDAIRLGDARIRALAAELLSSRLEAVRR